MKTDTISIKDEIHLLVDEINDTELLQAVRVLLKPHHQEYIFSKEDIVEFDQRMQDRKNNVGKSYTLAEAKEYFKNKK